MEKTFWGTTTLMFLGFILDTVHECVCVPADKVDRAVKQIQRILEGKKTTVHALEKLCGYLNFLCRCIVPGCAFTRRIYSYFSSGMKPYHHIRINQEIRYDLQMWLTFLNTPSVYCRPFIDYTITITTTELKWETDASGKIGFGGICGSEWMQCKWSLALLAKDPSIEYLELFTVVVSVTLWGNRFANLCICMFCDNQRVVQMINNSTSSCKNCMVLIRKLTLMSMERNLRVFAKFIKTKDNCFAVSLSHFQMQRFWRLTREHHMYMSQEPTSIPSDFLPVERLWVN